MAGVPRTDFKLLRGEPTSYVGGTAHSGTPTEIIFCGRCGSLLYTALENQPELLFLKTGTLDDTRWFQPQFHVWCDHKQDWVAIDRNRHHCHPQGR
jgi:hypothetical protein